MKPKNYLCYMLPNGFINSIQKVLPESYSELCACILAHEDQTTIRLNSKKQQSALFEGDKSIDWEHNALVLSSRPLFAKDPLWHAGAYYVQEAGSMISGAVLRNLLPHLPENPTVLDLCAAPGGKSTHILQVLDGKGWLVANEVIKTRAGILEENIVKWGHLNVSITNQDPAFIGKHENLFDVLVIDAPCSGEGMFRKDPNAISEWSESNVELCAARQQRIVADIWDALKPGGFILYSTCTFNTKENEENAKWICDTLGGKIRKDALEFLDSSMLNSDQTAVRCYPHLHPTEGFFLTVIQKDGEWDEDDEVEEPVKSKKQRENAPKIKIYASKEVSEIGKYLPDSITYLEQGDFLVAIPEDGLSFRKRFERLYPRLNGIPVAEKKGKSWVPTPEMALCSELIIDESEQLNVSLDEALWYLKGECKFEATVSGSLALVCYQNVPLGWAKPVGNRFNNQWPKGWRLRMDI